MSIEELSVGDEARYFALILNLAGRVMPELIVRVHLKEVNQERHKIAVAREEQCDVGMVHAQDYGSYIQIGELRVEEAYRGRGFGRKLIHHIETWAQKKGRHTLKVAIKPTKLELQLIMHRLGFQEVESESTDTWVIMEKQL